MKIITLEDLDINSLAGSLMNGQVLAMPTETAYGLVVDATNVSAVDRIYKIKQRDASNPLPVICSSFDQVIQYFTLSAQEEALGSLYWPGPLSLVLLTSHAELLRTKTQATVNPNDTSVAVRVTSYELLQQLSEMLQKPLVATSANISGDDAQYDGAAVVHQFKTAAQQPDVVVDAGVINAVAPSTIAKVDGNKVCVLRQGPVTF